MTAICLFRHHGCFLWYLLLTNLAVSRCNVFLALKNLNLLCRNGLAILKFDCKRHVGDFLVCCRTIMRRDPFPCRSWSTWTRKRGPRAPRSSSIPSSAPSPSSLVSSSAASSTRSASKTNNFKGNQTCCVASALRSLL